MQSIAAKGLTRKFNYFTAVDDLNLEVKEGEVFGQVSGTLFLGNGILFALIGVFALVDVAVFYVGVESF